MYKHLLFHNDLNTKFEETRKCMSETGLAAFTSGRERNPPILTQKYYLIVA